MTTIPQMAISALENEVKNYFVGYSLKRVSWHLDSIVRSVKTINSFKSFLGIKYKKNISIDKVELQFTDRFVAYYKCRQFIIECAVDKGKKKVYWKVERVF